jgi:hypothetical protein
MCCPGGQRIVFNMVFNMVGDAFCYAETHPTLELATWLRTTIVVIDELPNTPDTLWLRLTGKGRTQEDAIAELLLLPESNPKRGPALGLLVSWRISMELAREELLERFAS